MATASVILDIRANTQRALSEFKAFSAQLDNKFLVSGLKLDVVRNALSQINREFQKSLGEQGLASAQSLKAAENQAAILTNIYAGFSKTASGRIVEDFSSALNLVAVRTGSTITDVQKTLALSPYLSRSFSQGLRENILVDIQNLQTAARRAGLGGNTADILNQFLTGQTGGIELQQSGDTLSKMLGAELTRVGGGMNVEAMSIEDRTRLLQQALKNIDIEGFAKETGGFRAVLEQFSSSLFNPKAGLLGAMRDFILKTGEAPTNLFKETTKLFESIFGERGFIKTLARELGKAFGVTDPDAPIKFLGRGIRFITNLISRITSLIDDVLQNPVIQGIIEVIKKISQGLVDYFKKFGELVKSLPNPENIGVEDINQFIRGIGENIRALLRRIGAILRGEDISDEAESGASILNTIVDEAGNTVLTFFKEIGDALLAKAGTIALEVSKQIVPTVTGLFVKALTGEGGLIGQILSGLALGGGLLGASRFIGGVRQNVLAGPGGPLGAINRFAGSPIGPLSPRPRVTGSGTRTTPRMGSQNIPPGLDDLISSVRNQPDRYSLDPMFESIRRTNEIERFNREFGESQRAFRDKELFQRRMAASRFGTEGPLARGTNPLAGSQYLQQIGPLPHGSAEPWTMTQRGYQPYMGQVNEEAILQGRRQEILRRQIEGNRNPLRRLVRSSLLTNAEEALPGSFDMSRDNVAARFNRRYGSGGTRAVLGRGISRMGRGIGGYIRGGGGTGLIGLAGVGLAAGGSALGESIGGETGQDISSLSQIGGGAISGASMGAMIGSIIPGVGTAIGALVGGVIGAAIPLFDKGVRESVGRFTNGINKSFAEAGKGISKALSSGIKNIQIAWDGAIQGLQYSITVAIPEAFSNGVKFFTQEIPKKIKEFVEGLGASMLDAVKGFNLGQALLDTWEKIKNQFGGGAREVGGPVIRGTSYIVGERGPEIFTPGENGNITTNRDLNILASRASSGVSGQANITFNVTINATGMAGNDIAAAIQPAVMKVLDDSWKQASSNIITRGSSVI